MTDKTDFEDKIDTDLPNNSLQQITPEVLRGVLEYGAGLQVFQDQLTAAISGVMTDINSITAFDGDIEIWAGDVNTDLAGIHTSLDGKVDKVTGKVLSENDFTNTLKSKLDGIAAGATNTDAPVNADWNAVSGLALILNKPTIPAAQVNSDWNAVSGFAQILNKPSIPSVARTTSAQSFSIVTSTSGGGTQISATKDSTIRGSVQIVTTASIGGNQSGSIVLETCPTNSTTADDWTTQGTFTNGQALTLAITLQSVQTTSGQLVADLPAGYYARFRSINNAGTPSYSFLQGQKTIYG